VWGVRQTVQAITLTVRRGGPTGALRSARTTALGTGGDRLPLPLTVGILPGDDLDTPVWIEALGCGDPNGCDPSSAVVAQRAVVRFTRGRTEEVPLLLASACVGATCGSDERCNESGRCEPATRATVRPFDGVDAGTVADVAGGMDRGTVADVGTDAGSPVDHNDLGGVVDALAVVDVPTPDVRETDAGAPSDAEASDRVPFVDTAAVLADSGISTDDGTAPEDVTECTTGMTRDCYTGPTGTLGMGRCVAGFQRCSGSRWEESCNGQLVPQTEGCNNIDDDCDGMVDDVDPVPCYLGPDLTRDVGVCRSGTRRCRAGVSLCGGQTLFGVEVCGNGLDDNCNRQVDEGCSTTCAAGQTLCSGRCAATDRDGTNCGACGARCGAGSICVASRCVANGSCPADMVLIPGGMFTMGYPAATGTTHGVRLTSFCIDRTEVTVAAYARCVAAGECSLADSGFSSWGIAGQETHPINGATWVQATAYCAWAGLDGGARRLPTEAQWEFAARGTDGRLYPWGNQDPTYAEAPQRLCWNRGGLSGSTCPVGMFAPTPIGLFDMAGNEEEWVSDCFAAYGPTTPTYVDNPTGPMCSDMRVIRGGWWGSTAAIRVSAAFRGGRLPTYNSHSAGFRCARDP